MSIKIQNFNNVDEKAEKSVQKLLETKSKSNDRVCTRTEIQWRNENCEYNPLV